MPKTLAAFALAFSLLIYGCSSQAQGEPQKSRLVVAASFYPIYEFAKGIAGERAHVYSIVPFGVEPHEFEPSPSDAKRLRQADLLVLNGAGMELAWIGKLAPEDQKGRLRIADASEGIPLIISQGSADPHIWLSPKLAQMQVENIKEALAQADPEGREQYEKNAGEYRRRLAKLDAKFRQALSACKKRDLLITHATVGYFCQDYGCNPVPISGLSHADEPSASKLAEIVELARQKNISAIYFESLSDQRFAEVVSKETGLKPLSFNSLHGISPEDEAKGRGYFEFMEENLESLKEGLECDEGS
ncbi:MAG: zinc ABC transporter substrate-binding protein [Candidatus Micrarchaeota archaeon]|nr:zinc ABC transporter substrate-binding protein [Candidatus Micrarchaeota archaeon]